MTTALELMLADLLDKYDQRPSSKAFDRLYDDPKWSHMFAVLHKQLNEHFVQINDRAQSTRHYWADNSRDLIGLIKEIESDLHSLRRAHVQIEFTDSYEAALERCRPWLSPSGGSTIPEDFEPIDVISYEPIFRHVSQSVTLRKQMEPVPLKMVGSGSYANVYSYEDPDYGIKFALKRAKKDLAERDLARFRQEFEILRQLKFPYVVEVYRYDEERNEYRMEYCDDTLRGYIAKHHAKLTFASRKRIALQFLYGINYLHFKRLLHRDISLQNILVKEFHDGAVLVKLSDFGLAKDTSNPFTLTQTEMKGTVRDPMLDNFKNYAAVNEIYAIGHVLAYIFTGRQALPSATDEVGHIIHKCTSTHLDQRYQCVPELLAGVEGLKAATAQPTA